MQYWWVVLSIIDARKFNIGVIHGSDSFGYSKKLSQKFPINDDHRFGLVDDVDFMILAIKFTIEQIKETLLIKS